MRFARMTRSLALLFLVAVTGPALAQDREDDATRVTQRSLMLAQLGQEAAGVIGTRTTDPDVRDLAADARATLRDLVEDMRTMADTAGLPGEAVRYAYGREQAEMLERLRDATGADIDRQFLALQRYVSRNLLDLYEQAAELRNDDVRRFARDRIDTVRDHARRVERVGDRISR
jgi:predicted outer membrane protein